MKIPQPTHTFRIYPGSRRGKYYTVQVFRTLKDMRGHCHKSCHVYPKRSLNGAYGVCHHFTKELFQKGKRWITDPNCGTIHLANKVLGIRTLTHECTHAALYVLSDGKNTLDFTILDEPLASMVGNLVHQAVNKLYDAGIWK